MVCCRSPLWAFFWPQEFGFSSASCTMKTPLSGVHRSGTGRQLRTFSKRPMLEKTNTKTKNHVPQICHFLAQPNPEVPSRAAPSAAGCLSTCRYSRRVAYSPLGKGSKDSKPRERTETVGRHRLSRGGAVFRYLPKHSGRNTRQAHSIPYKTAV